MFSLVFSIIDLSLMVFSMVFTQKSQTSAARSQMYRGNLMNVKVLFLFLISCVVNGNICMNSFQFRHVSFQDLNIFENPASQPILFCQRYLSKFQSEEQPETSASCNLLDTTKHVVVFVHGFQVII